MKWLSKISQFRFSLLAGAFLEGFAYTLSYLL